MQVYFPQAEKAQWFNKVLALFLSLAPGSLIFDRRKIRYNFVCVYEFTVSYSPPVMNRVDSSCLLYTSPSPRD